MRRTLAGLVALLLLLPALRAEDDKDQPAKKSSAAGEEYQALVKEYEKAQEDYTQGLQKAKTAKERQKLKRPRPDQFTGKFLALARKSPQDPAAFDALNWVVRNGNVKSKEAGDAAQLLLRD